MKKLLIVFLLLIALCGCDPKEEVPDVNYTYEIVSDKVDMSGYAGVSSTDHPFRMIKCQAQFNTIDK